MTVTETNQVVYTQDRIQVAFSKSLARLASDFPQVSTITDAASLKEARLDSLPLTLNEIRAVLWNTDIMLGEENLDGMFGISFVEEGTTQDDCARFVFGPKAGFLELGAFLARSQQVTEPIEGAVAIYWYPGYEDWVKHVGFATNRGTVLSKWGRGWVYEHPPMNYPLNVFVEYYVGKWTQFMTNQWLRIKTMLKSDSPQS